MSEKQRVTFEKGLQPVIFQSVDAVFQAELSDDGFARVEGQAACYGNWFTVAEGKGWEVQRRNNPGMFQRALSQNPDIVLRLNHEQALARTHAGTLQVWETDQSLMFRGKINTQTSVGNDVYQNMKDGLITQGSVQYWPTVQEFWTEEGEDKMTDYQDIFEGKLDKGDVSVVLWGANPQCQTNLSQIAQMAGRQVPDLSTLRPDTQKALSEAQESTCEPVEQEQASVPGEPAPEPPREVINLDAILSKKLRYAEWHNQKVSTGPTILQDALPPLDVSPDNSPDLSAEQAAETSKELDTERKETDGK